MSGWTEPELIIYRFLCFSSLMTTYHIPFSFYKQSDTMTQFAPFLFFVESIKILNLAQLGRHIKYYFSSNKVIPGEL